MKILLVHNIYKTHNIGGEDIVFQQELRSLRKKLGEENVFEYTESNDDINLLKLFFSSWFSLKNYRNVYKIVKENNIDIVHVHNFFPLITPSIFKAAHKAGAKVVHTLHNYRLWCISGILYNKIKGVHEECAKKDFAWECVKNKCYHDSWIQSFFMECLFWFYKKLKLFDFIDYYFVLTEFEKKKVISFGLAEKKVILKPNIVDVDYKNIEKENYYVYVGRLVEDKGVIDLLHVWSKLNNKFKLILIGGGELEAELKEKYNKENIIFKGNCSREETLEIIGRAKYLLQTSLLYETFGLTIIEAMTQGVPVIGNNLGTRPDFIKDCVNGFLYEKDNMQEVIEKSYNYLDYPRLIEEAFKTAQNFTEVKIINKQIEIYNNILK